MKDAGSSGFERWLRSITLKPAPPELRGRILTAAAEHRERKAWTTPLLRRWLAACAVILAILFVTDAAISRMQQSRLQALMDGSPRMPDRVVDESRVLAEALGEDVDLKLVARNELAAANMMKPVPMRREEVLRELLKEDFDGSQSSKNIY